MRKKHIFGSLLFYFIASFSFYKVLKEQLSTDVTTSIRELTISNIVLKDKMKFIMSCRARIKLNKKIPQKLWVDHFKNPCFHGDGTLHCLPYFLVAGFPKCGTTDLFERMRHHPEFVAPKMKELHWLSRYRFLPVFRQNSTDRFEIYSPEKLFGLNLYTQMFNELAELLEMSDGHSTAISADFSPSTLWDNDVYSFVLEQSDAPKYYVQDFVRQLNPCMKFIVMMRDPTERLYSDYLFLHQNNTAEGFHTEVKHVVKLYKDCIRTKIPADCFNDYNLSRKSKIRLRIGAYSIYLRKWLNIFPRDQFYFLRLEDYASNTKTILKEVFDFLDMGGSKAAEIPLKPLLLGIRKFNIIVLNSKKTRFDHLLEYFQNAREKAYTYPVPEVTMERMLLQKPFNSREGRNTVGTPMLNRTYEILSQFYGPFNHNLSLLLGDTKYLWHS